VKLGYPANLADGVVRALEYYKDIDLDRFRKSVADALRSVLPETGARPLPEKRAPPKAKQKKEEPAGEEQMHEVSVDADEEETVLKLIESLDASGKGAPWDKILEAAEAKKMDKVRLEEIIASLLDKGEIYEPELGMMKRI
jgi:polyphosphate kinase 2 (PPK2 family)